ARDHAKAASLGGAEKRIDRFGVHGAEDHGGGRTVAGQLIEKELRDFRSVLRIAEAAFLDKRVVLQPVEQLAAACANDIRLRVVDVIVDESGQQEVVAMIVEHGSRRQLRKYRVGGP